MRCATALEEREQPFVLAVPSTQRVGLSAKAAPVVAAWPDAAWQRLSAGEGSQGPRWYDWAWMPMPWRDAPAGMAHFLLARRSVSHPDELAYYFVFGPATATLEQVAQVAGMRWQVEQAFELAKGEVGLDEYEVRTWVGWYRHITLAMFALAYLTVVRQHARQALHRRQPRKKGAATGRRRSTDAGRRPVTAHGSRGAALALGAGLAGAPSASHRFAVVGLASPPPSARQALPHQASSVTPLSAAVVLVR